MTYKTTVQIAVFGEPVGYSVDALITEFKSFVEANSQFSLAIIVNKYGVLADDEICHMPYGNCPNGYWPASSCLHVDTKAKFLGTQVNMMLYDYKGKAPCFGGACECWMSVNGVPFIQIPLGVWPLVDNSPGGPWHRALSQSLVHEWMHALDYILNLTGYVMFPSSDSCGDFGYTSSNDPGWANCLKYFLSTLTTPMYEAVQNWGSTICTAPTCSLNAV